MSKLEQDATRNIKIAGEAVLPHDLVLKTETLLAKIDPNDVPFVALTGYLDAKLWTGDMKLYRGLKANNFTNVLTGAELFLLIDKLNQGLTN